MNPLLSIQGITKLYEGKKAVDNVSLTLHKGQIIGLLGPNGAGKTSLIRMITSITLPDEGQIFFKGEPLKVEHQKFIGYMPEERGLYKKMTVLEQLIYLLRLRGLSYQDAKEKSFEWLKKLYLEDWKDNQVNELSKGMQQKVQFILTVAHDPELLILDEPFSGLDPLNAQIIENYILELKNQGKTVLFSTHRMEQAENFCEQIALINQGKLIINDTIFNLKNQFKKNHYLLKTRHQNYKFISEIPEITVLDASEKLVFQLPTHYNLKEFFMTILEHDEITHFEEVLPSLSEIFIQLVSKEAQPLKSF
jgi:ABC-2 type transport system ATP-binding protein